MFNRMLGLFCKIIFSFQITIWKNNHYLKVSNRRTSTIKKKNIMIF